MSATLQAERHVPIDAFTWARFVEAVRHFVSEVGWRGRSLSALLIAFLFGINGLNVVNSYVARDFMTAMQCARDPQHLAREYCQRCRLRLYTACYDRDHRGHAAHPYHHFNWSVRQPQHLGSELGALVADALHALRVSVGETR